MKTKAVINEDLIVKCLRKVNKSDEEGENQIVRNIDDVDFAVNKYQEFFRDLETLENAHSESLTNRTAQLIESHGKKSKSDEGDKNVGEDTKKSSGTESSSTQQDDTKEMDENVEILLKDKESLMTSIVTSNDIHVGKLLGVEDEMRERLSKKSKEIVERIHESERERNRSRILDIKHFHQSTLNEIEMTSGDYSS